MAEALGPAAWKPILFYIGGDSDEISLASLSLSLNTTANGETIIDSDFIGNTKINLFYTNNSGERKYITYNSLLNTYKAKERQMYQIDNMNLYNADGSVNQDAIVKLNE